MIERGTTCGTKKEKLQFRADAVRAAPETARIDAPLHVEEPAVARAPEELAPGHVEAVGLRLIDVGALVSGADARERRERARGPGVERRGRGVASAVGPSVGGAGHDERRRAPGVVHRGRVVEGRERRAAHHVGRALELGSVRRRGEELLHALDDRGDGGGDGAGRQERGRGRLRRAGGLGRNRRGILTEGVVGCELVEPRDGRVSRDELREARDAPRRRRGVAAADEEFEHELVARAVIELDGAADGRVARRRVQDRREPVADAV
mmetsp:Transcript_9001/g.28589  ORF Transcript_9001/g.28589 Transcript_9001/m.28589 type:complete len:266 (-) Transcript_9001:45-842(-)